MSHPPQRFSHQPVRNRGQRNVNPYAVAQPTAPVPRPTPRNRPTHAPAAQEENGHEGDTSGMDGLGGEENEDGAVVYIVEDIEDGDGTADGEGGIEEEAMDVDPPFDTTGLKEIGNLASWTVSSHKPGCGIEALRNADPSQFWQSDGPQPHHLNIHFSRLVAIRSIRIHLDFEHDESYTPTRITLLAGSAYHDLLPFAALEFSQPQGWIDVPLDGVGGGRDGKELRAFLVQVKIVENHQNGKDTHVRGLRIYARDDRTTGGVGLAGLEDVDVEKGEGERERDYDMLNTVGLAEPDWMGEPELR